MAYSEYGSGSESWFNPGTYLKDHLGVGSSGYASGPERALMSALLFDGVQSFMNYVCAESESQRKKYREAYNWVVRPGEDYVFSFESVCDALGVDTEFLRLGLLNACNSQTFEWKKARRNF